MKLMILDGNSLVNRAFYGVRPLSAPDGTPTNAVYGFFAILQKLLEEEKPEGLCVAFDLPAPTFRHREYAGYKATRRPMPEELAVQLPLLKEALDAMGACRCQLEGWEADDLLGTVSLRRAEAGDQCVLVTGDRDALQLVGPSVRVLHVKTRQGQTETVDYTPQRFQEEYGFEPARLVDLKALMGDSSDNIPGVPGVGEKTALDLIRRFGSLDGVYGHLDDPSIRDSVRRKLAEGEASARLSFRLAAIHRDAPLELPEEQLRLPAEYPPALYRVFRRLGFSRFIEKWGLKPEPEPASPGPAAEGECVLYTPETVAEALAGLESLQDGGTAYIWYDAATGDVCIDQDTEAWFLRRDAFSPEDWRRVLAAAFSSRVSKAGHNIKGIQRALLDLGVDGGENWVFDTALAAYLLDSTAPGYELERLTMALCGFEPWRGEAEDGQLSLDLDGREGRARHAGAMASAAAAVAALEEKLRPQLQATGVERLYFEIELPLCAVLAEMEHRGFLADREALRQFGDSLREGIARLQEKIWAEAGERFNINSPKQLGTVLFEHLGLPGGKKTKTGWGTGVEVLEKLRGLSPVVQDVLDYRELTKLCSTYADGLLKVIGPDGRIHTSFQMTVTATGRLSSTDPNLQNIPVRRELGAGLRRMFVAGEGNVLVDADYSQIELRLLAHISGDENMRQAFLSGEDIHRVTASQVFGVPLEEVTPEERRRAKAVNFGIVYGISAFSLSQDLGVTVAEAKSYMDAYLTRFSGVREYQKRVVEQARRDGYVATLFGRRRYLPELRNANFNTRAFGERVALNMPIQGTAADVIKLAMVNVDRRLKREGLAARLILQVHDELILECPQEERERAAALLREEMETAVHWSVPLTAEAKWGRSWAQAH